MKELNWKKKGKKYRGYHGLPLWHTTFIIRLIYLNTLHFRKNCCNKNKKRVTACLPASLPYGSYAVHFPLCMYMCSYVCFVFRFSVKSQIKHLFAQFFFLFFFPVPCFRLQVHQHEWRRWIFYSLRIISIFHSVHLFRLFFCMCLLPTCLHMLNVVHHDLGVKRSAHI